MPKYGTFYKFVYVPTGVYAKELRFLNARDTKEKSYAGCFGRGGKQVAKKDKLEKSPK